MLLPPRRVSTGATATRVHRCNPAPRPAAQDSGRHQHAHGCRRLSHAHSEGRLGGYELRAVWRAQENRGRCHDGHQHSGHSSALRYVFCCFCYFFCYCYPARSRARLIVDRPGWHCYPTASCVSIEPEPNLVCRQHVLPILGKRRAFACSALEHYSQATMRCRLALSLSTMRCRCSHNEM